MKKPVLRRLFLIRHAKSLWKELDLVEDQDRPLSERGISDAYGVFQRVHQLYASVDMVISSPAIRALHTALIFSKIYHYPNDRIQLTDVLYSAGVHGITSLLGNISNDISSLALFTHEPEISELANHWVEKGEIEKFVTSGVLVVDFLTQDWKSIHTKTPNFTAFICPNRA